MEKKQKSVLIVDDSLVVRKAITKFLENYNVKIVGTATDGNAALEMFKKHSPDIVTLDITMPGIDGFEVLEEIIKLDKSTKVMVITALSDKATGLKALRSGAKSYLTKPFGPLKLKEAFERLIE
jgi:two-component system, chemotaxis family, chemotaxis protein CheY